jgi:hypothetical protein
VEQAPVPRFEISTTAKRDLTYPELLSSNSSEEDVLSRLFVILLG